LLGNGSENTAVAKQWLSTYHVMAITYMHATTDKLLEAVSSVRSMLRLYKKGQLPLPVSLERVFRQQLEE
jgi:hypothetical protein